MNVNKLIIIAIVIPFSFALCLFFAQKMACLCILLMQILIRILFKHTTNAAAMTSPFQWNVFAWAGPQIKAQGIAPHQRSTSIGFILCICSTYNIYKCRLVQPEFDVRYICSYQQKCNQQTKCTSKSAQFSYKSGIYCIFVWLFHTIHYRVQIQYSIKLPIADNGAFLVWLFCCWTTQ